MTESYSTADRQIARGATIVMAGFVLSNIVGLAKWVLVSNAFGTSASLDSFNAANRLPEMLFFLMAGGALASAFIPTFTEFLTRGDRSGAWKLASAVANLLLIALSVMALVAALAAPWLVNRLFGFENPAQISLTIRLLRILLLSVVLFGMSGLIMAILNAHQKFLLPALAPTALWIGWILGVLLLVPSMGIEGLAWGVVLGAVFHLSVQLPGLRGLNGRYTRRLGLGDPTVGEVGRLMVPRLIGVAAVQLNFLVNVIIASRLAEGSLTSINYAFFIMLMPQVVIAQAIAIAALPTFSEQAAQGKITELRESLSRVLRAVLFLAIPATIGLVLLRRAIVSMLFERGAFSATSTELVAWALLWFGVGLVGHSLVEVLSRAFYALKDTRTPVAVSVGAMSLNVLLSLLFVWLFGQFEWPPFGGLALANSLATGLEAILLVALMRRRLNGLAFHVMRRGLIATTLAAVVMGILLWLWLLWTAGASVWLIGLGGVLLGGVIFWLAALLLRAPEARQLPAALLQR